MSNRVLIITPETLAEIAEVVKRAEANPLPLEFIKAAAVDPAKQNNLLALADRKPGFERPPSATVLIAQGYRVAFSVEQQPAGLCNHLSVSVDDPAMLPSPQSVMMIAEAYGMPFAKLGEVTWWLEEFEPGHHAVNVVSLRARRQ